MSKALILDSMMCDVWIGIWFCIRASTATPTEDKSVVLESTDLIQTLSVPGICIMAHLVISERICCSHSCML